MKILKRILLIVFASLILVWVPARGLAQTQNAHVKAKVIFNLHPHHRETTGKTMNQHGTKFGMMDTNSAANHVESDGNGNLVIVVEQDTSDPAIIKSIEIHEQVHIDEALAANPNIAQGVPAGYVLGSSDSQSEVDASNAQLDYLNAVIADPSAYRVSSDQVPPLIPYRNFITGYRNNALLKLHKKNN